MNKCLQIYVIAYFLQVSNVPELKETCEKNCAYTQTFIHSFIHSIWCELAQVRVIRYHGDRFVKSQSKHLQIFCTCSIKQTQYTPTQ